MKTSTYFQPDAGMLLEMKKTAVVIITVALLGILGVAEKSHGQTHQLVTPMQTSMAGASSMTTRGTSDSPPTMQPQTAKYKDGTYTGDSEFTPYGPVQISVVVSGGKISNINFLQMPNDREESLRRTQFSEPLLKQTAISNQSANIDFVSGATDTSYAFQQSL